MNYTIASALDVWTRVKLAGLHYHNFKSINRAEYLAILGELYREATR